MNLIIRAFSPDEEFSYLWDIINKLKFFEKNGYRIKLPESKTIQDIASNPCRVNKVEREFVKNDFVQNVYNPTDYVKGVELVNQRRENIRAVFPQFQKLNEAWGFKTFPEYKILLTLYGPGGSYNSGSGVIIMLTTKDGGLARHNPIETIIHEMVHIGIDENIVEKYKLTHWEKETLVDLICTTKFGDLLPDYRCNRVRVEDIVSFVNSESINELPKTIEKYIAQYPRK